MSRSASVNKNSYFALAIAGLLGAPALADDANLGVMKAGVDLSLANLSLVLEKYHKLPCLTPEAKAHLENVHESAVQAAQSFSKQYNDYVAVVNAPMQGNGKCDGGFNSVVVETDKRRARTERYAMQTYNLQMSYAAAVDADFSNPTLDVEDESQGEECAKANDKLYQATKESGEAANDSFNQFRSGVTTVAQKFRAYSQLNAGLGNDCGSLAGDIGQMFTGGAPPAARGQGSGVTAGDPQNRVSLVTGEINDASLPDPGQSAKLRNPGLKNAVAPIASGGSSSSPSGAHAAAVEREASLRTFGQKLGASKDVSVEAEALEVQALLGGGDAATKVASRVPASDGKAPATSAEKNAAATERAAWDSRLPGDCFETAKCDGKAVPMKGPAECPATLRFFLPSAPGASCQHLPPK